MTFWMGTIVGAGFGSVATVIFFCIFLNRTVGEKSKGESKAEGYWEKSLAIQAKYEKNMSEIAGAIRELKA